jgi:hypothetical protein
VQLFFKTQLQKCAQNWMSHLYKVVQIWPGLIVLCVQYSQSRSYLNHLVFYCKMMQWNQFWKINIILLIWCSAVVCMYVARNTAMKVHLQYQWEYLILCLEFFIKFTVIYRTSMHTQSTFWSISVDPKIL